VSAFFLEIEIMTIKKDFAFVDVSGLLDAKEIDGMAPGVFMPMFGGEVEFKPEEMPEYVMKTQAALESTRGSDGEIVGFPIDAMNHNNREAAGWLVGVRLEGLVIKIMPRWNGLGQDLIGSDLMRYFSPTVDPVAKVIMGGSLTNWPATRTKDHQLLLRPVELSNQLQTMPELGLIEKIEMAFENVVTRLLPDKTKPAPIQEPDPTPTEETPMNFAELTQEQKEVFLSQARAELASGTPPVELQAFIEQRAANIAELRIAESARKTHISELCVRLTGGTNEHPTGLPIANDELAAFLASLDPDKQATAEALFSRIHDAGMISFSEKGSSRTQTGNQILPAEMAAPLNRWIAAGKTIEEFFKVNAAELGSMADYNLTEFVKENK
jgi:hypothetical protein